MTLQEIQYKAQAIMQKWRDEDSAPYVEFVEELALMDVPELPDGLEKAAEKYLDGIFGKGKHVDFYIQLFIAGAQYAAPRWISVDEKLPKMDEEVIVLTDELGTAPIYKIAFGHIVDVERCIDYNGWNCPGVKYWMLCPEIPNND